MGLPQTFQETLQVPDGFLEVDRHAIRELEDLLVCDYVPMPELEVPGGSSEDRGTASKGQLVGHIKA